MLQNNKIFKTDQILCGNYLRVSASLRSSRGCKILQSRANSEEFQSVLHSQCPEPLTREHVGKAPRNFFSNRRVWKNPFFPLLQNKCTKDTDVSKRVLLIRSKFAKEEVTFSYKIVEW